MNIKFTYPEHVCLNPEMIELANRPLENSQHKTAHITIAHSITGERSEPPFSQPVVEWSK